MDKLKLIKTIVVILTFLLVFGTLSLLGVIYKKNRTPLPRHEISYNLEQPRGSGIADFKTEGENLYILLKNGGLPDRLIIYNRNRAEIDTVITVH